MAQIFRDFQGRICFHLVRLLGISRGFCNICETLETWRGMMWALEIFTEFSRSFPTFSGQKSLWVPKWRGPCHLGNFPSILGYFPTFYGLQRLGAMESTRTPSPGNFKTISGRTTHSLTTLNFVDFLSIVSHRSDIDRAPSVLSR